MKSLKKLKIAVLGSNVLRIPPTKKYVPRGWSGAPEWAVYNVAEGLVERGHNVTLFASGNSKTSAKLESINPVDTYSNPNLGLKRCAQQELMLISKAYQMAQEGKFDVINSHVPARSGLFAKLVDTPTVATLHSPLDHTRWVDYTLRFMKDWQHYVSISNAQREPIPDLNYVGTIPHGVITEDVPWEKTKDDYLLFAGRFVEEKGADKAIEIAKESGHQLILLGSPPSKDDKYWKEKVEPQIDGEQIIYKGHVDKEEVFEYMKNAKAFLFPISWKEPFGLTMIESIGTGTPVIAYNRGSVPEVIKDKKTGFIITESGDIKKDLEAMVEAVKNIDSINPEDCRKDFESRFSRERMAQDYENIFYKVLRIPA